ncbi:MAG: hypothetical protein ORN49_05995, partial [Rhodobacteraceae bacterium]|nr:hypothetical protein [Paracoccaceae bacterium]
MTLQGQNFPAADLLAILDRADDFAVQRHGPLRPVPGQDAASRLQNILDLITATVLPRQLRFQTMSDDLTADVRNGGLFGLHSGQKQAGDLASAAIALATFASQPQPLSLAAVPAQSAVSEAEISWPMADLRAKAQAALADIAVQEDLAALSYYDQLAGSMVRRETGLEGSV